MSELVVSGGMGQRRMALSKRKVKTDSPAPCFSFAQHCDPIAM